MGTTPRIVPEANIRQYSLNVRLIKEQSRIRNVDSGLKIYNISGNYSRSVYRMVFISFLHSLAFQDVTERVYYRYKKSGGLYLDVSLQNVFTLVKFKLA
jgi:hypothetical protein